MEDLPAPKLNLHNRMRPSVSAEAYGKYNSKAEFKPRVIEKSSAIKTKYLR